MYKNSQCLYGKQSFDERLSSRSFVVLYQKIRYSFKVGRTKDYFIGEILTGTISEFSSYYLICRWLETHKFLLSCLLI